MADTKSKPALEAAEYAQLVMDRLERLLRKVEANSATGIDIMNVLSTEISNVRTAKHIMVNVFKAQDGPCSCSCHGDPDAQFHAKECAWEEARVTAAVEAANELQA